MVYAHSAADGRMQPLEEHLREVSRLAGEFAAPFGMEDVAAWLGWWHDVGKVTEEFQAYLLDDRASRGPDHSSAGMLQVAKTCQPFAFNIAGHHGGLDDCEPLRQRLQRKLKDPVITGALEQAIALFGDGPVPPSPELLRSWFSGQTDTDQRRAAFRIRMVHSALVDADCLDTERHFEAATAKERRRAPEIHELQPRLETGLAGFRADTLVNRHRAAILRSCLEAAHGSPGFYRLTVPTGGGKTLSGMAFALRHAMAHGLRRVIVALPFTSIIEQNAKVYRDILGEAAVLEHHSAVGEPERTRHGEDGAADDNDRSELRRRLAADNWDRPVVVTTTVQFFESLFAARNSRLRKLHNIARSVIILDEVQALPVALLSPTLEALRFLVEDYGCTVVLSSATQPALRQRDDFPAGIASAPEIVPDHQDHFRALQRVTYELPLRDDEPWSWDRVAGELLTVEQGLVVLNTIDDAQAVLAAAASTGADGDGLLHLSTQLCGAHRHVVLAEIRRRLDEGLPCHLVSTQVVEAGVDLDFPMVMRALGPLDRIVQAAGRCNREGRRASGRVVVFAPAEGGTPPGSYRTAVDITVKLLRQAAPPDLHDPAVFESYFASLYSARGERDLDKHDVATRLSKPDFAAAARAYRLIEDDGMPVIVDYEPWRETIEQGTAALGAIGRWQRDWFRRLQPVLVTLRRYTFAQLQAEGLVVVDEIAPEVYRWAGSYDRQMGLVVQGIRPHELIV